MGLTVMAWIFSIVSLAHCSFVQVEGIDVGLFKVGFGGSCVKYTGSLTGAEKTARAFGVLLTLSVSAAMILVFVAILICPNRILWMLYRILLPFSFVFNLLTFVIFAECMDDDYSDGYYYNNYNITCSVGGASVCAILNSWLLLGMSITSCVIPMSEEPLIN